MACLDTTALIDLMPRKRGVSKHLASLEELLDSLRREGEMMATTRINLAELYVGLARTSDPQSERKRIANALAGLEILEFDEPASRQFGVVSNRLALIGRPAGDFDAAIAAIAMVNNQRVITRNPRHFIDVPGLDVLIY